MKPKLVKIYTENSDFQYLETLRRNRTKRHRAGEFFVEGVRAIRQALENQWEIRAFGFSGEKRLSDWAAQILSESTAPAHYELPLDLLKKLSQKEATSELIAVVKIPADDLSRIPIPDNPLIVVLDRIMSPGNLGTLIRSGDALGVAGIIMTGHSADLYAPETIRATTGSFFSIPVVRLPSLNELTPWIAEWKGKYANLQIVGTSAWAETSIQDHDFTPPTILLIGNENHGLSQRYRAVANMMVTIPIGGSATSLNVACAAAIILYEIARQRGRGE